MRCISLIAAAIAFLVSLQAAALAEPLGTYDILSESGKSAKFVVLDYGLIVSQSKRLLGDKGKDSLDKALKNYRMTYEVVHTDQVPVKDGTVVGYQFKLPKIRSGDRIVVHYTVNRPHRLPDGSVERQRIDAPWTFDHSYSGATRTLFTEFKGPQATDYNGEWELGLVVNGKALISQKFNFFEPK